MSKRSFIGALINAFKVCYLILIILFSINHLFAESQMVSGIANKH